MIPFTSWKTCQFCTGRIAYIYNKVNKNNFNNVLNVQKDFKNNTLYTYILDND